MTVDLFIVFVAVFEFIGFLLLHTMLFRVIEQRSVLKWLVKFFVWIALVGTGIQYGIATSGFLGVVLQLTDTLLAIVMTLFLYTGFVFIYIVGIFGVIESAIRIRILHYIYHAGTIGVTKKALLKKYNTPIIIQKRLARLVQSGEIRVHKGTYELIRKISFLRIMETSIRILWYWYRGGMTRETSV